MDPENWIAVGSAVIALIAMTATIAQTKKANSFARISAEQAVKSTQAATRSAGADERAAAAAEEALAIQRTSQSPWKVERRGDRRYALMNTGSTDQHRVEMVLSAGDWYPGPDWSRTFPAGSEHTFTTDAEPGRVGDIDVIIGWYPDGGTIPRRTLLPLPPTPRN